MSKKKFSLFMAIILMATSVYPGGYVFAEDAVAEESAIETPTEERVADEEEAEILTETTELIAQESQTTIAEEAQSTEDTDVSEILVEDIVEVETPAENTELAIGGEMQQGLNAESIAEDEESPKITNLEFENLPRFNMLGSGQFYLVQVKATFSDGSTGTSSSWTGDVDRYGKNGLCADIYGENGVVKGRVWMSLLKDGERLHDFDGGFGTDDEIIFGEYTLEVYDEKNENMRISTQITVERPSELTDISLGNPVSFSMQKYGNAWYKLQVPKTGTYCFPLALSKGNLSGIIATYNENETGVIVKHWFSSSKGFSMELMEGQTYVVYLDCKLWRQNIRNQQMERI